MVISECGEVYPYKFSLREMYVAINKLKEDNYHA